MNNSLTSRSNSSSVWICFSVSMVSSSFDNSRTAPNCFLASSALDNEPSIVEFMILTPQGYITGRLFTYCVKRKEGRPSALCATRLLLEWPAQHWAASPQASPRHMLKHSLCCHTTSRQLWDNFGTTLGQLWDNFETTVRQLWDNFETTLRQLWDNFGTTLRQLWDNFGTTLRQLWDTFSPGFSPSHAKTQPLLLFNFGTTVRQLWVHFGTTLRQLLLRLLPVTCSNTSSAVIQSPSSTLSRLLLRVFFSYMTLFEYACAILDWIHVLHSQNVKQ